MRRRTRRRIKNIAMGTIAVSCAVGVVTLLVQSRELGKGMLAARLWLRAGCAARFT